MLKGSTRIIDSVPSFRMRRLRILWCHENDVIESRDVTDDVTNRCAVGTFLQASYWTWNPKSLSFPDIQHQNFQTNRHRHVDWQQGSLKASAREPVSLLPRFLWTTFTEYAWHVCVHTSVSKKNPPPVVFWNFFPNGWEFLISFHTPITPSFIHYSTNFYSNITSIDKVMPY